MLHQQANWSAGWKLSYHIPLVKGQMESVVAEVSLKISLHPLFVFDYVNGLKNCRKTAIALVSWK